MKKLLSGILALIMAVAIVVPLQTSDAAAAEKAPSATKVTSIAHSGPKLTVKWNKVSGAAGYEIQYGNDRFFLAPTLVDIGKPETTTFSLNNASSTKLYYARVRSYKVASDGTRLYSAWALSSNCRLNKNASITPINKNGERFELRSAAKQDVGKCDTLQGGCTYGNTGWFILYDRKTNKCKVVKMNMSNMTITKTSKELKVSHGSDLAYNPNTNQLVVAHGPSNYKLVSIVNPDTLELVKTFSLTLPKGTPGASKKHCSNFKGVTAFTYNVEHHTYVGRLKTQGHLIMYDDNFKAVRYVKLKKKDNQLFQGMDSYDDFILIGQSFAKRKPYNIISVYDWDGNYLSKVNVTKSFEMENLFHSNGQLYAGFYRSYYKTYYLDGWKIKVTSGKKNKVKTKLKVTRLQRDGYFYKIGDL